MKKPPHKGVVFSWLPLLDEFRTQNWGQIKEEIGIFILQQRIALQDTVR